MLALGVGANGAVFSVGDAVLLRPLLSLEPQGLVQVDTYDESRGAAGNISYPDFFDWRAQPKLQPPCLIHRRGVHAHRWRTGRAPRRPGCLLGPSAHARRTPRAELKTQGQAFGGVRQ